MDIDTKQIPNARAYSQFQFPVLLILQKILKMTPKEAKEKDVSRPTLWKVKKKIREEEKINFNSNAIKKLC